MCLNRKEYEGSSAPLYPRCLNLFCSSTVGARSDLPLTISVEVLPLFERFFVSNAEQSHRLLFSPSAAFFCLNLKIFFPHRHFYFLVFHSTQLKFTVATLVQMSVVALFWMWLLQIRAVYEKASAKHTRGLVTSFIPDMFFPLWVSYKNKSSVCPWLCFLWLMCFSKCETHSEVSVSLPFLPWPPDLWLKKKTTYPRNHYDKLAPSPSGF